MSNFATICQDVKGFTMKIIILLLLFINLNAANWLMLQGTQKKPGHKLWGFFQIRAEDNAGDIIVTNGINKTPFSYIRPTLKEQSTIQIARARLGLRGSLTDDNKINYFLLTEFGQNGITRPIDYHQNNYITDASVTFKHLPIFIRIGKFKYAGSEEGFMARFASPFIHFTTLSDQLLLERFINKDPTAASSTNTFVNTPASGVGAYRDSGIQLFQTYALDKDSTLSFAYMLGNGSGISNENLNDNKFTHYGYLAYEKSLGKGKGYKKEALKLYTWYQNGKRQFYNNQQPHLYDRIRYGIGGTYVYKGLHLESEFVRGNGMIFTGAKDVNTNANAETWMYEMQAAKENTAYGYYLSGTYRIHPHIDVLGRYDEYRRLPNNATQYRKFQSSTIGFSYILQKYDRIDVNYQINRATAPQNSTANNILKGFGDLLSLQYTMVFN